MRDLRLIVITVSLREPQIMIKTGHGRLFSVRSRAAVVWCCQRQAALCSALDRLHCLSRRLVGSDTHNEGALVVTNGQLHQ